MYRTRYSMIHDRERASHVGLIGPRRASRAVIAFPIGERLLDFAYEYR